MKQNRVICSENKTLLQSINSKGYETPGNLTRVQESPDNSKFVIENLVNDIESKQIEINQVRTDMKGVNAKIDEVYVKHTDELNKQNRNVDHICNLQDKMDHLEQKLESINKILENDCITIHKK